MLTHSHNKACLKKQPICGGTFCFNESQRLILQDLSTNTARLRTRAFLLCAVFSCLRSQINVCESGVRMRALRLWDAFVTDTKFFGRFGCLTANRLCVFIRRETPTGTSLCKRPLEHEKYCAQCFPIEAMVRMYCFDSPVN